MNLFLKKHALILAWLIALFGLSLSVYFREILSIESCPLCWYQRIGLVPVVVILGMALYRGDLKVITYLYPFVIFGLAVALYQVMGWYYPSLLNAGFCGREGHCSSGVFSFLGFITFPMMSALGFGAILALFLLSKQKKGN